MTGQDFGPCCPGYEVFASGHEHHSPTCLLSPDSASRRGFASTTRSDISHASEQATHAKLWRKVQGYVDPARLLSVDTQLEAVRRAFADEAKEVTERWVKVESTRIRELEEKREGDARFIAQLTARIKKLEGRLHWMLRLLSGTPIEDLAREILPCSEERELNGRCGRG